MAAVVVVVVLVVLVVVLVVVPYVFTPCCQPMRHRLS